jgi:DNA-binding Lrp family transcriptional regulator
MLTKTDKILLDELQFRFPVSERPYVTIARRLGLKEGDVISRVYYLQKKGVIRYTGMIFDLKNIGAVSTLVALSVPKSAVGRVAKIVNMYPGVSHNYLRDDIYNMWFTLSSSSGTRLKRIVRDIRIKTACGRALDLRTQKVFKAKAVFKMGQR